MSAEFSSAPDAIPPPDPAMHMTCCWIVASAAEMKPKARARAMRRMEILMDPTRPAVVRIRPRAQDRAVEEMRVRAAAYWRAVFPALAKLVELGE